MPSNRLPAACLAAALVAAACAALPLRAPADGDAAAQALLAKHRAYVGWQLGDPTFKSLRIASTYTNDAGKKRYTETLVRSGLVYRSTDTDLERAGVMSDEGFTGNVFWQSDENGFTVPSIGDAAKASFAYDVLMTEATTELPATSRGADTIDGKAVQIVRVSIKDKISIDLYIDPDTGAYVQAVVDPGGTQQSTMHVLAYAEALPGKRIISSFRFGHSKGTWTASKIEANVPLGDADFHPPAPRATWAFANPAPFAFKTTDTRFIVDAKVNGVAGKFIVDTGADGIFLSHPFARRAGAKPFSNSEASGIAGTAKIDVDRLDSLEIGGNTLSNVIAFAEGDGDDEPDAPDGVIGFSLFGGAIVTMDSEKGQMTIGDPQSSTIDHSAGVVLNVDLGSGTPAVPMKLNGNIDVNATLDSGDFYYVLFGSDLITQHGLKMLVDNSDVGFLQSHPFIGGIGGYEADRCGHVDSLALGPIVYQNPPACESPSFSGRDILVGFDYLRHFNFVFDYPHGQLIFVPHKER